MKNKWIIHSVVACIVLLMSCAKEDIVYDEDIPLIKIHSPVNQGVFTSGDTIDIHVVISDNDELHEIEAKIMAESMGAEELVWELATHTHEATYDVYYRLVVPSGITPTDYTLEVEASDHHNNIGQKSLTFQAM